MSTTKRAAISVNIHGRGDRHRNDGPSHMGIALYSYYDTDTTTAASEEEEEEDKSDRKTRTKTCRIHHVRCPDEQSFIYDPRHPFPLDGPMLWGRCIVADDLSAEQCARAEGLLSKYGSDPRNLPEMGLKNCQDWVAGAVAFLESAENPEEQPLVKAGEGAFWTEQIGKSGDEMGERCRETGRSWIPGERKVVDPGDVDARFWDDDYFEDGSRGKKKAAVVGRLVDNPSFRDLLLGFHAPPADEVAVDGRRGLFVSSPFFSTNNNNNGNREVVTSNDGDTRQPQD